MCGIFGVLGFNHNKVLGESKANHIINKLKHRGPDDIKVFCKTDFVLAHSRLAIIDPKNAIQPMVSEDGRWVIAFNGEVYNFLSLKRELENKSIRIKTNSDTEVLFKGLIKYGTSFLERVKGMYAFVFYDMANKEIILGRDHLGIKPLYYSITKNHLVFASEPKAILESKLIAKKINKDAIFEFLCRHSPPYLQTFYQDILEVEPGSCLKINYKKNIEKIIYYKLEEGWKNFYKEDDYKNEGDFVNNLEEKLGSSIQRHLVSDVPVGLSLSGGIDSCLLADLISKNKYLKELSTFTYSATGKNDESKVANNVIKKLKNIKHHTIRCTKKEQVQNIKKITKYFDGPVSYPSSMSLDLLSNQVNKKKIKVLLSGQGADELFFGYDRYTYLLKKLGRSKDHNFWAETLFYGRGDENQNIVKSITWRDDSIVESNYIWDWIKNNWDLPPEKKINIFDQKFRLLHLLKREDVVGMKNSVEFRVPYLDIDFLNWANGLNEKYKEKKKFLRKLLRPEISKLLPKKKFGSVTSIDEWFKSESFFKSFLKIIKSNNSLSKTHLNYAEIIKLLDKKLYKTKYSYILRNLYFLEIWFKNEKNWL